MFCTDSVVFVHRQCGMLSTDSVVFFVLTVVFLYRQCGKFCTDSVVFFCTEECGMFVPTVWYVLSRQCGMFCIVICSYVCI